MAGPALTIALLLKTSELVDVCRQWLPSNRYELMVLPMEGEADLVSRLEQQREAIDAVVVGELKGGVDYHSEELHLASDQLAQLGYNIDAAISRYLRQARVDGRPDEAASRAVGTLSRRLQERLGYLGVFYKRDPARFLGSLPPDERHELLESLQRTYRDLLISYFSDPAAANQALESFVNTAFFIDLPITRTVEIHVDLIDEFWKQLRLEGHKNDFLQDYRLALLDVMAHLCEMYRRSIPPDIPLSGTGSSRFRREPDLPEAPEVST